VITAIGGGTYLFRVVDAPQISFPNVSTTGTGLAYTQTVINYTPTIDTLEETDGTVTLTVGQTITFAPTSGGTIVSVLIWN